VKQTSLALVRFEVKSVSVMGKFLAQYTIPFDCIKSGQYICCLYNQRQLVHSGFYFIQMKIMRF